MQTSDCFSPGFVLRPHGIKGSVLIGLKVEDSTAYAELGVLFIEQQHSLVPYLIEEISVKGNKAYVKFEGISTPEQAEALKNKAVYIPLDQMPEADAYSPERMIGFQVNDQQHGPVGTLTEIGGSKAQKVLSLLHPSGKEIMIPYTPEFISHVDHDANVIFVNTPEGLIDLYLNDDYDSEAGDEEE